jgi:fibronectin type 3 domain-containing protein
VSFPSIEPPAPPTGLEARDLATGIRVRWEYPRAAGEEAEPGETEGEDEAAAEAAETEAGEPEMAAEEELEPEGVPEAEEELEPEEVPEAEAEQGVEAAEEPATEAAEEEPGADAAGAPGEPALAGFNLYRRKATERTYGAPLRTVGARSRAFVDESALFGERYIYAVSAVASRRPVVVESRLAEEVEVDYRDRFAPPVPQGLVALSEEGRVRLVWQESAAPDLVGYRIYRRGPESEDFRPLPGELVTATEHADRDLAPGGTYHYRVTAVDRLGNESRPSETVTVVIR